MTRLRIGAIGTIAEWNPLRRLGADLRRRRWERALFRHLIESTSDVVIRLDQDFTRTYVSPSCRRVLGYAPEEMQGSQPNGVVHDEDWPRVQQMLAQSRHSTEPVRDVHRNWHKDGRLVWLEGCYSALPDGGYVVLLRDVTEGTLVKQRLEAANAELVLIASRDPLTGLANRRRFDEMLPVEARRANRNHSVLSLLMLDIDRFKQLNDRYGHQVGDDCLRLVAGAVQRSVERPADLAARYGGEEFVVLLPDTDENGAAGIARRILDAVRALSLSHAGNEACGGIVTVSIGCAAVRFDSHVSLSSVSTACVELLHQADRALYEAKRQGRDQALHWSDAVAAMAGDQPGPEAWDGWTTG